MTRHYLLQLLSLCWALAGLATSDQPAANLTQELSFALMSAAAKRSSHGHNSEAVLEIVDLLAA